MTQPEVNMDQLVDYTAEYSRVIKKHQITGDQLIGCCPFHDDKKNSFSANLKTGQWKCFTEDESGNFTTFFAKLHGLSNKDAYQEILKEHGAWKDPEELKQEKEAPPGPGSFTLEEYAFSKRLPVEFLKDTCGAQTGKDRKTKTSFLKLPYFNEERTEPIFRKRYADKEFRWSWGSSGKLILYGDWRLPEIRQQGWAILVEGESDTQTLWYLKFPALGVPGASVFKPKMVPKLQDLKLYIHVEPDKGGETFLQKITQILREGEFIGEVYSFSCKDFGFKDPSDLYLDKGGTEEGQEEVKKMLLGAIKGAKKLDLDDLSDTIPEVIKGAPVNLRQPEGWMYSEGGIRRIDEKTQLPVMVCRTPIILTQRLRNMETGEEKIEIAFKRDDAWHRAIFPRSTIFTARAITSLADLGCTITSENAKQVVRFLEALEAENIDIITKADSTSTMGWQTRGRFLPGHGDDIILDIEPSLRSWAAAYHYSGTFEDWRALMEPHRERDKFRFIMAASFTAPLLKILSQRIFFVYNWGGSKGGKTAALKAALSAWGDPEHLMVNFNATQVALERMAGFYNDLPMGIDERQLAGSKQENLEKIVYMIASGTGRARGSKGGGLQALNTWRTVALATGEEPLSTDTTQTGVSTRVLEIYGGPFDDEKSASLMHQQTSLQCGWAGPEFIRRILQTDENSIRDYYSQMTEEVYKIGGEASGAHIAGISAVALADAMIEGWIFHPDPDAVEPPTGTKATLRIEKAAWDRAVQMARTIIEEQLASGTGDVNEHATQFIVDWILSNKAFFSQNGKDVYGVCYGLLSRDLAHIFPARLNEALEKAGYSPRKTIKYLADSGIITTTEGKNGKRENCVRKWFDNRTCRLVEFHIGQFAKQIDAAEDEEAAAAAMGQQPKEPPKAPEADSDGFTPFEGWQQLGFDENPFDDGSELPF